MCYNHASGGFDKQIRGQFFADVGHTEFSASSEDKKWML